MTTATPGLGGEYPAWDTPVTPHDTPFHLDTHDSYDNGLGPIPMGGLRPNVLSPIDPDMSPSDGPDVPGPYAPVATEE